MTHKTLQLQNMHSRLLVRNRRTSVLYLLKEGFKNLIYITKYWANIKSFLIGYSFRFLALWGSHS